MEQANALLKKFHVQVEGKTNGAHQEFVQKLKSIGHTQVESSEDSDYRLLFCPIVSRVGTDISEALEKIQDNKPTILVVMHQTFSPDHVVAASGRLVEKGYVRLTVDCLFYQGRLLTCDRNEIAWSEIKTFFGVSQASTMRDIAKWLTEHWKLAVFGTVSAVVLIIAVVVITEITKPN